MGDLFFFLVLVVDLSKFCQVLTQLWVFGVKFVVAAIEVNFTRWTWLDIDFATCRFVFAQIPNHGRDSPPSYQLLDCFKYSNPRLAWLPLHFDHLSCAILHTQFQSVYFLSEVYSFLFTLYLAPHKKTQLLWMHRHILLLHFDYVTGQQLVVRSPIFYSETLIILDSLAFMDSLNHSNKERDLTKNSPF